MHLISQSRELKAWVFWDGDMIHILYTKVSTIQSLVSPSVTWGTGLGKALRTCRAVASQNRQQQPRRIKSWQQHIFKVLPNLQVEAGILKCQPIPQPLISWLVGRTENLLPSITQEVISCHWGLSDILLFWRETLMVQARFIIEFSLKLQCFTWMSLVWWLYFLWGLGLPLSPGKSPSSTVSCQEEPGNPR